MWLHEFWGGENLEIDRFERFSHNVIGAIKSLQALKVKHMEKYGLSGTHTICLRLLCDNEEGLTKGEISSRCEIDKAQITRIVNELLSKGYVHADNSQRAYNRKFFLTEKGRRMTDEINAKVKQINTYVSEDISDEDIERFYDVFERINEKLRMAETKF